MQTTGKYNKIMEEATKPQPASTNDRQEGPTGQNRDRVIILTEIRTIITKTYVAGEPSNHQS